MASEILVRQAEKMYAAKGATTDIGKLLTGPTVEAMNRNLIASRVKLEGLIAAMPAGIDISKVPEELRGMVTRYLTDNKAAYVEASKVAASGLRPTDPRYIEAIETMNRIRGGFETLDASLLKIQANRKLSIDSLDYISTGATMPSSTLHNKFASGEIYGELTLQDGSFYYIDHEGERIDTKDYKIATQQQTLITESMQSSHDHAIEQKRLDGDFNEDRYRDVIRTNLVKAKKDGRIDFVFSIPGYIEKYIAEKHNVTDDPDLVGGNVVLNETEFKKLYESYKNADFRPNTEIGKELENYLVNKVFESYNGAKTAGETAEFDKPEIYGAYRSKKDIDDMNNAIANRQASVIGFNNEEYIYNPTTDQYDMGGNNYSADDVRIRQKILGYKTGEDPPVDQQAATAKVTKLKQKKQASLQANLKLTDYFHHKNVKEHDLGQEEELITALQTAYPDFAHLIYAPSNMREKVIVDGDSFFPRGRFESTPAMEMKRLQKKLDQLGGSTYNPTKVKKVKQVTVKETEIESGYSKTIDNKYTNYGDIKHPFITKSKITKNSGRPKARFDFSDKKKEKYYKSTDGTIWQYKDGWKQVDK